MLYVFPFRIPTHHVKPIQQIKTHSIFKERLIRFWICQSAWKFIQNSVTICIAQSEHTHTRMCCVFHSNFNLQRVHFWSGNKSIYHWHIAKTQHTQLCVYCYHKIKNKFEYFHICAHFLLKCRLFLQRIRSPFGSLHTTTFVSTYNLSATSR